MPEVNRQARCRKAQPCWPVRWHGARTLDRREGESHRSRDLRSKPMMDGEVRRRPRWRHQIVSPADSRRGRENRPAKWSAGLLAMAAQSRR